MSVCIDFPTNYTYDIRGCKKVNATTTAVEHTRLSAAFSATASGHKLPTLLVVPCAKNLYSNNIQLVFKTGSTFNDEIMVKFLTSVVQSYMETNGLNRILLFIDSARCHLTYKVKTKYSE